LGKPRTSSKSGRPAEVQLEVRLFVMEFSYK